MHDKKRDTLDIAMDLYRGGRAEEARTALKQIIAQMPSGWRPRREDAESIRIAFWNMDEFQLYVAYNRKSKNDSRMLFWDLPSYSRACYLLAFIENDQRKTAEALRWLDQGLSLEPDHPTLLSEKALALQQMGRHADAVELHLRASTIRPWATVQQRARALRGAAVSSIDLGQLDEAERLLQQSLVLEPHSRVAHDELAYIVHLRRGGRPTRDGTTVTPPSYSGGEDMMTVARMPYEEGNVIGEKYEIHDVLGKGGFGVVYKVFDRRTGSIYALKTFRDEFLKDEQTRKRFRSEASLWIDLERHPYVVQAHFVEEVEGRLYIGMEYVAPDRNGLNTLEGHLHRQPPDLAQSLRWSVQFCHGMEYAYSKGLRCHRDIKPANIMIGDDKAVRIADFGLAGVMGASAAASGTTISVRGETVGLSSQTIEGTGFGTPTHMPPEQFTDAASCDERSDIYSFGVVLFQMASGGSLPFLAPRPSDGSEAEKARFWREMYRLHSNAPMPRINSPLFPTIERCMEKDPARRFQSFSELRGKLELALKTLCEEVNVAPTPRALGAKEWNAKGVSLDNLGRHDEALSCYERALDADPQFALAWNNKGAALDALDRREEALRCYEKALDVDPELALAWGNKGASLANLGRYLDAVRCYDRALELDPLAAAAWSGKRSGLLRLGRYDEASRCNNRKLESANRIAQDWALEGTRLWTDGHLEQAVDCLSRAVEISPPAAGAWSVMGLCLMSLRRYEEVVRCYDRLLEIDPWTREPTDEGSGQFADSWAQSKDYVLGNRGRCLYHLGRHAEAMRDFREALRLNPRLAPAWSYSGLCLSKLGRHDEAIRCHDNAQKSDPQFALAWFNKGLSLELQGQKNDAILAYRQFIAMARDASSAEVQEAHTRLRGLE